MPSFDWITRDWDQLVDQNGVAKIDQVDFLRRSGNLDEDSDWGNQAREWGKRQSPIVEIGSIGGDEFTVVLKKRS